MNMNFHNLSASYLEREVFIKCYNQSCFILVPFGQSDRLWWKVGMPYNCHVTGFSSVQSRSRVWLFATPWIAACPSPMPEFTQTHVHQVRDAIQPSHPLSSPSPPAPNPSQHQTLFQWVNSSHEVAKVLEFQLQHHSFQRTPRTDLL